MHSVSPSHLQLSDHAGRTESPIGYEGSVNRLAVIACILTIRSMSSSSFIYGFETGASNTIRLKMAL